MITVELINHCNWNCTDYIIYYHSIFNHEYESKKTKLQFLSIIFKRLNNNEKSCKYRISIFATFFEILL